jgi:ubiquinone biosynthesis protein
MAAPPAELPRGEPTGGTESVPLAPGSEPAPPPVRRALRFVARALAIAYYLSKHGLIWFFGWLGLVLGFRGKARRQAFFGDRVRALFCDLGATFIKVGQIMSTRPDLLPPHLIGALEKLQDDVGAVAFKDIEKAFIEDFQKPPSDLFESFSKTPIASASVAQVHRAVLAGGREVAVKVRRPRIEQIVSFDLSAMRLAAKLLSLSSTIRLFAPVESVDEFARAIRMQIDLSIEADNNRRFQALFAGDPDVEFPELIPELCTRRVLTMSFIEGVKVLDYRRTDSDPTHLAKVGFRTLLKMVFEDGFVHADLHPGNIFVSSHNTITILDLGLTAELDETHRRAFAQYFAGWAQGNGQVMAKLMYELSPAANVADYEAFEREITEFVGRYRDVALGDVHVSQVAFDMMNILRRHRVRVNPTFTMCNIAIAVTEGIGKQLDPGLDLLREGLPFFMRLQQEAKL